MIRFLFPRLTPRPERGTALFEALVREARQAHWYTAGAVPDTLNGRFAVLATLTALTTVRLEALGGSGESMSVALSERFVAAMDSEHRELGLGDPGLGKTVRKLMGALARRVGLWREAEAGRLGWREATDQSLYGGASPAEALGHAEQALRSFHAHIESLSAAELDEGRLS